jgi:hypothetical protein
VDKNDIIKTIEKTNRGSFSAIPSHRKGPDTRIAASFPDAQKGSPLRQNHRDNVLSLAAQGAARVSCFNSWSPCPDCSSNIPRHLLFGLLENCA